MGIWAIRGTKSMASKRRTMPLFREKNLPSMPLPVFRSLSALPLVDYSATVRICWQLSPLSQLPLLLSEDFPLRCARTRLTHSAPNYTMIISVQPLLTRGLTLDSLIHSLAQSFTHALTQLINQSINQSTSQSIIHLFRRSTVSRL